MYTKPKFKNKLVKIKNFTSSKNIFKFIISKIIINIKNH